MIIPSQTPSLPTGTVTFLFTDLEGSTRLWDQAGEQMRTAMARHDAIIEGAVTTHSGVVVRPRGEGDSRFAVFQSAANAVAAAAEMQRALFVEPWMTPAPLRVRIALHTGEADVREGDYYGTAVNRCARLRTAAHGGQTLLSQSTWQLAHENTPGDVSFHDLGEHRLKDLLQPEHIYQLDVQGLPTEFPPLRSLESFHTNLPATLTSFIGREHEMREVKRLLSPSLNGDNREHSPANPSRLLTIVGPGGAGKTRLSLQVGADLVDVYRDGVWLIELASLADPALITNIVANTLGIREEPGRPILETLLDYLRDRRLLIILDNCEHVIQAAAELAETLLRRTPFMQILATSREPLHVNGEHVWHIPSLSLPRGSGTILAEQLTQYEAVRLFIDRAVAVRPDFQITNENAPAVAQICARLDGIPLAIELAAARVRLLPVQEIAARLDDRFRLLVGGSRTALPRQRTLRALVDWSYDLLSEQERALFRRLAVFVSGFTLEAAEGVCTDEDQNSDRREFEIQNSDLSLRVQSYELRITNYELLDLLSALVDKSLVMVHMENGTERYQMLETIRQYAFEHLKAANEAEVYTERHARYFQGLAKRSYRELWGPRQEYWLPRLEMEHDNIRTALEWASSPDRSETLLFMTATLWRFWEIHGHLSEGRAWLERALARTDDAASLTPRQKWYRANALRGAGNIARLQGDYDQALGLHAASFTLFREVGDQLGIARELDVLGEIARYRGEYARAISLHEESLALRRAIGDKEGIAASLGNLGVVAHDQGDNVRARELLEESLKLNREVRDKRSIALALNSLGRVAHAQCDYERATRLYGESVALYQELDDKLGISFTLQNLGSVAADQGDLHHAGELYEQCLTLKRELGDKRGIARAMAGLAEVGFFRGDYVHAQELAESSIKLFGELDVKRGLLLATNILAYVCQARGEQERAAELAQTSMSIAVELGTRRSGAYAHQVIGLIAYGRGDYDEAIAQFRNALDTFRETGDRRNMAFTLVSLARAAYRQGNLTEAEQVLNESLSSSQQVGNQWGVSLSLEIMGLVARARGDYQRAREHFQKSLQIAMAEGNQQGIVNCLGGLAGLFAITNEPKRGVYLFAAAERMRRAMGASIGLADQAEYEEYLNRVRSQLAPNGFQHEWDEGCALTIEQAVAQALGT